VRRELLARACEASLLCAVINAQAAGLATLADEIAELHLIAGDRRRELEAAAARPLNGRRLGEVPR
jgi:hypothetical protein